MVYCQIIHPVYCTYMFTLLNVKIKKNEVAHENLVGGL